MRRRRQRILLKCATVLTIAAAAALIAIPVGTAQTQQTSAHAATVPSSVTDNLRELNNKLARAISQLEKQKKGAFDPGHMGRTLNDLEATKLRAVDGFPAVFGRPYPDSFTELSCIDEQLANGKLILLQLRLGRLGTFPFPGTAKGYAHRVLEVYLKNAKACKDTLEVVLSAPQTTHCSGHAQLADIYGGQAHQLQADFTCPKSSTAFSLILPSGYQFTSGQASNSAGPNAYTCSTSATNGPDDTVNCRGTAPANSTSYIQTGTSPNPQAGMILEFKVYFTDGSTESFTVTSK